MFKSFKPHVSKLSLKDSCFESSINTSCNCHYLDCPHHLNAIIKEYNKRHLNVNKNIALFQNFLKRNELNSIHLAYIEGMPNVNIQSIKYWLNKIKA